MKVMKYHKNIPKNKLNYKQKNRNNYRLNLLEIII